MARAPAFLKSPVTYILASYALVLLFLLDCVNTFREFYPVVIYLTNSTVFQILGVNAFIATAVALWKSLLWLFFGRLTSGETMAVATAASMHIGDCTLGLLYSDQGLTSRYAAAFALTAVWQVLHRVERERLTVLGSVPLGERRQKVLGLVWFALVSIVVNVVVVFTIVDSVGSDQQKNALALYTLAMTYAQSLFTTLHVVSMLGFGAWRSGDLSRSAFFIKVFWNYVGAIHFIGAFAYVSAKISAPFPLVRYLLLEVMTVSETTLSLQRYLRLSLVTGRLPAATAEDLQGDPRCSICYEDMVAGAGVKRLPCGHCYHGECLQQWFQSNSTCPYCRADLLRRTPAAAAPDATAAGAAAGGDGQGAPAPQPQPQPQQQLPQQQQQPRSPITGDAAVDAAVEAALVADEGNHLNVVIAYERYRQQWVLDALRRRSAALAERPPFAAAVPPPNVKHMDEAATASATATAAGESPPAAAAPQDPQPTCPTSSASEPGAERGAPTTSTGGDAGGVLAALRQAREVRLAFGPAARGPTVSEGVAVVEDRAAVRLRAFERYRAAITKAEEELRADLANVDDQCKN